MLAMRKIFPCDFENSKGNKLKMLPLNEELSKKVYSDWDRGKPTEIYKVIESHLK